MGPGASLSHLAREVSNRAVGQRPLEQMEGLKHGGKRCARNSMMTLQYKRGPGLQSVLRRDGDEFRPTVASASGPGEPRELSAFVGPSGFRGRIFRSI